MKLVYMAIENFRGVKAGKIYFNGNTVLVGDNNTGKSTVLEAIDLVLGPERMSKHPVIDEHDFYAGQYLNAEGNPVDINVEVIIIDLNEEQQAHFRNHIEWWSTTTNSLINSPPPEQTDEEGVLPALRLHFRGYYDKEEDDFVGETSFSSPQLENGGYDRFNTTEKRKCGFLYLRTLRTGSRALSLEHGSLLDIILRIKELRPQMWEGILQQLYTVSLANDPEFGISEILMSVQSAVRELVPIECADAPQIRVSQMTREHLRQILTVFLETGAFKNDGSPYAAPYHHQGTGTINTLVLSLLSLIAELRQNVIFAMEEPEIALPPHTQKRVINSVISKSAQAIFTSHSPYVLEEFDPCNILVMCRCGGILSGIPATYPPAVKPKAYKDEVKRRFCEALLARRVLIVEGRTEYDAISVGAKHLSSLNPTLYSSLEGLGIATIDAGTDSQIAPLGTYFKGFGKTVYAVFDKQDDEALAVIKTCVDMPFEASEKGFEKVILNGSDEVTLKRYALNVVTAGEWPQHLDGIKPNDAMQIEELKDSLFRFFKNRKGEGVIADFIVQCNEAELSEHIKSVLRDIRFHVYPQTLPYANADGVNATGEQDV